MPDLSFSKKIRLLIVDDSFFFRTVLKNGLDADPRIEVVGMAADAEEAFKKIRELNPDVVTMDVEMPKLNGIDFIKRLIPVHPVPGGCGKFPAPPGAGCPGSRCGGLCPQACR